MTTRAIEIAGQSFGQLVALERHGAKKNGTATWKCRCSCGTEGVFDSASLRRGHVRSCGCAWRVTTATTRICAKCKEELPRSQYRKGNSGHGLTAYCIECSREVGRERYHKNPEPALRKLKARREAVRNEVLAAYGGECACCGEDEKLFLAIDHKNNDGAEHRKKVGKSDQFYRWLKANSYPSEFQILCANCNWGKYVNGGVCPHAG